VAGEVSVHLLYRSRAFEREIGMDYLSVLSKKYVEFREEMEERGASVVVRHWDDFGDTQSLWNAVSEATMLR
jgi:hypothetical protein